MRHSEFNCSLENVFCGTKHFTVEQKKFDYGYTIKTSNMLFMILQVDEMKQKETEKTEQLEKAKIAVLDCPMCGKALKTESVGQTLLICHQFT